MRCFLIGSKELSVRVLEELIEQGHDVIGVLSRDHEKGMNVWLEELNHRSLKDRAKNLDIPVYEKLSINSNEMIEILKSENLDILFSVFWGEIVKKEVLNIPRLGCYNVHTAYLPNNKGSFPLAWAIINNEKYTGTTIHKMNSGVDDGPIVAQKKTIIEQDDNGSTLYQKVTEAGYELFKETLPSFSNENIPLNNQEKENGSYHPRGYPYGAQINPYWDENKIERFKRALYFPPFKSHLPAPLNYLLNKDAPNVRVMLGFDCDRPRGDYIYTKEGSEIAHHKIKSIENISNALKQINAPRTFFVCGQFLESMSQFFDKDRMRRAFKINDSMVEIADHSYSHSILKKIELRPDKEPISPKQAADEFNSNTGIFKEIFELDIPTRGYRAPLGYYDGMKHQYTHLDKLKNAGVTYLSSDLRDEHGSLHPKLVNNDGSPRQPYRYENGLLEIPSMGWQDTVFSGLSKTSLFEKPPESYDQIIDYFGNLFNSAKEIAIKYDRDYFLGLVLHPYDISFYDGDNTFFFDLNKSLTNIGGTFCTYDDVRSHYS